MEENHLVSNKFWASIGTDTWGEKQMAVVTHSHDYDSKFLGLGDFKKIKWLEKRRVLIVGWQSSPARLCLRQMQTTLSDKCKLLVHANLSESKWTPATAILRPPSLLSDSHLSLSLCTGFFSFTYNVKRLSSLTLFTSGVGCISLKA